MMAFFLLMWLLNATTEAQRLGLADYFSPTNLLSHASSGTGQPFGGHTAMVDGAMVSDRGSVQIMEGRRPPVKDSEVGETEIVKQQIGPDGAQTGSTEPGDGKPLTGQAALRMGEQADGQGLSGHATRPGEHSTDLARPPTDAELRAEAERREREILEATAEQIREAVADDPALADLAKQLAIDLTPEGLRIQIMDEVRQPMFATGSSVPNERARALLRKIAPVLRKLPQAISISGHTDAAPFAGRDRTNWELSSATNQHTESCRAGGEGVTETENLF